MRQYRNSHVCALVLAGILLSLSLVFPLWNQPTGRPVPGIFLIPVGIMYALGALVTQVELLPLVLWMFVPHLLMFLGLVTLAFRSRGWTVAASCGAMVFMLPFLISMINSKDPSSPALGLFAWIACPIIELAAAVMVPPTVTTLPEDEWADEMQE